MFAALRVISKEFTLKPGFINLETEKDLFKKLEYDYERLKCEPNNTYIAFDLFVTASHIADWLKKGHGKEASNFRNNHAILQVCDHLGCGAKHFSLNNPKHVSVVSAEKSKYVEDGYFENDYVEEPLEITLETTQAELLGVNNPVSVINLAELAICFWKAQLNT